MIFRSSCVRISAGQYTYDDISVTDRDGNQVVKRGYLRKSLDSEINISKSDLLSGTTFSYNVDIKK